MEQNKFGRFLKELRENAKISQRRLARELHFDQAYLSRLEAGINRPNLNVIQAFSVFFEKDPLVFFALAFPPAEETVQNQDEELPEKPGLPEIEGTHLKEKIAVTG